VPPDVLVETARELGELFGDGKEVCLET